MSKMTENIVIAIQNRLELYVKHGLVLRKWTQGNTNFLCEVCEKEQMGDPIYVSVAETLKEIKDDAAATCTLVVGSGCAKKIIGLSKIQKL